MINDLLDLTRIEQGRVALDQQPADATELVRDALERHRSAAEDAGITLQCQLEASLPLVLVDKERIEHVFDNLMTNALRHTDRGGTIILRAVAAEEGTVQFSVEDTGEGIPASLSPGCSTSFSGLRAQSTRAGPGLVWRSCMRSSSPTGDRLAFKAQLAKEPLSRSASPRQPSRGTRPGPGDWTLSLPHRLLESSMTTAT